MKRIVMATLTPLFLMAACSHSVHKVHTDPKTGTTTTTTTTIGVPAYQCAPSVYYYEPATVHYVATYCGWPRSRVEYYFSLGWSCDDIVIGFEFSRRCHRPWSEVVYYYDRCTSEYRETHHITNVYNNTTVNIDQSQHVWQQVNNNINVQNNVVQNVEMNNMVQNTTVFAEGRQDLQAQAISEVYKIPAEQAEEMLEKGYDAGELAKAAEEAGRDGKIEVAELEMGLKENHAEFEKLEEKVESGDVAELKEAVDDSKEPDWKPEDEEKVASEIPEPAPAKEEPAKEMTIEVAEPEKKEAPRFESTESVDASKSETPDSEPPPAEVPTEEEPTQETPKKEQPPEEELPPDRR